RRGDGNKLGVKQRGAGGQNQRGGYDASPPFET
ncbi:MAG: hypothetical protein JWP03_2108, partial [Phycisphaerales bacterium]|nr:hypothetical protein [Phycisphaerales bacterium]